MSRLRSAPFSFCDVARELQRAVGGCATLHLPDGPMVSSRKPSLRDDLSPGATPCRGLLLERSASGGPYSSASIVEGPASPPLTASPRRPPRATTKCCTSCNREGVGRDCRSQPAHVCIQSRRTWRFLPALLYPCLSQGIHHRSDGDVHTRKQLALSNKTRSELAGTGEHDLIRASSTGWQRGRESGQ